MVCSALRKIEKIQIWLYFSRTFTTHLIMCLNNWNFLHFCVKKFNNWFLSSKTAAKSEMGGNSSKNKIWHPPPSTSSRGKIWENMKNKLWFEWHYSISHPTFLAYNTSTLLFQFVRKKFLFPKFIRNVIIFFWLAEIENIDEEFFEILSNHIYFTCTVVLTALLWACKFFFIFTTLSISIQRTRRVTYFL